MKSILSIVIMIITSFTLSYAQVQNLDVKEFENEVKKLENNAILLDVRTKKEVKEGYINGMINIDFYNDDFETEINKLDKNKTYYVYCAAGGRSYKAAKMLNEKGIKNVYNLNGGIIAWRNEGKKIEN